MLRGALLAWLVVAAATADESPIHLEFRAESEVVAVGAPAAFGLWAYTNAGETQLFRATETVFEWDAAYLRLDGLDGNGAVELLSSGFPAGDAYGLNESPTPGDGDGFYRAWAPLGEPVNVTSAGVLLTTFDFTATATAATDAAWISIAWEGGDPVLETTVWGSTQANTVVTGMLGGASIAITPEPGGLALFAAAAVMQIRRKVA